jgi:branched-chain amino acid transport system ATP-binding protein
MLIVEGLEASYDRSQVLFGVDFKIDAGEVVTLLGRNGMGKTTTVHSIFGLLRARRGRISIDGKDMQDAPPHKIAAAGIGLVPEGRQVFPGLTVEENLVATARSERGSPAKWSLEAIYAMFPRLKERRRNMGNELSGGEQQMLAIGRALMTNPKLVILDEATEGLAPLIRAEIWACLEELKASGEAILVIDKHVEALTAFADRHLVLEKGRVVWEGTNQDLKQNPQIKEQFLSV